MARVLLLEPDAKLAKVYVAALKLRGHEVVTATTAQDAICEADEQRPDMVVVELQLTKHSGIEFLYEFRSYPDWQNVPVVIMSQVPPNEFAASSKLLKKRLGVKAYHYKPYTSLQVLVYAVESALVAPLSLQQPAPTTVGQP